jgi:DNA-binding IclR family transcriptional regulator
MQTVQSVSRALRILRILADSTTLLPLSDVATRASLPNSTTHRLLASLRAQDFVYYSPKERTYGVGLAVLPLARAARAHNHIYNEAEPILQGIAAKARETATLVLLNDDIATYSLMARSERSLTLTASIGEIVPLHATASGKVMLAYFRTSALERVLNNALKSFTINTFTNPIRLKEELASIRSRGFAIDNEEREIGLRCFAAPVFDHLGQVVAAIGISGPTRRLIAEHEEEVIRSIKAATQALSARLGYDETFSVEPD